jgi:hypothetical protein
MRAQERFNVRTAPWIELGRPNIASGLAEGIMVALEGTDAETNNPRVLHVSMSAMEALDLATRLIRATLKMQDADDAPSLVNIGRLLLQSQQAFLEPMVAKDGNSIVQRMIVSEMDRISEGLATGRFLID